MTIEIPQLAPGLNGDKGLMRMHWKTYGDIRDDWTWDIKAAANGHKIDRASVMIDRYYARQPMDADNLYSTAKVPLDALRHAGVIPDDDPDSVVSLSVRQHKVDTVKEERTKITLTPVVDEGQRVLEIICSFYGLEVEDLRRHTRGHRKINHARHVAMYVMAHYTPLSHAEIGAALNRERSGVYHACSKIAGEIDVYPKVKEEIESLVESL